MIVSINLTTNYSNDKNLADIIQSKVIKAISPAQRLHPNYYLLWQVDEFLTCLLWRISGAKADWNRCDPWGKD